MRQAPTAAELLDTARAVLREELIPDLPPEKRHAALMIANAMAIALRQVQAADDAERRELNALAALLSRPATPADPSSSAQHAALLQANRVLCGWIREGRADATPLAAEIYAHLRREARIRVEASNPKYLGSAR